MTHQFKILIAQVYSLFYWFLNSCKDFHAFVFEEEPLALDCAFVEVDVFSVDLVAAIEDDLGVSVRTFHLEINEIGTEVHRMENFIGSACFVNLVAIFIFVEFSIFSEENERIAPSRLLANTSCACPWNIGVATKDLALLSLDDHKSRSAIALVMEVFDVALWLVVILLWFGIFSFMN